MFSDEMRPGRTFWRDDIFDIKQTADGPFYNVPGYLDNFKVLHHCICILPMQLAAECGKVWSCIVLAHNHCSLSTMHPLISYALSSEDYCVVILLGLPGFPGLKVPSWQHAA